MCSGRVDLEFILRAFSSGQDGVFIGGCRLGECNYITHGNFDALGTTLLAQKILEHIGLDPERLQIQFMSSGDGHILAEAINQFAKTVKEVGPLGKSEGIGEKGMKLKLDAARKLVPFIKLVERERLRVTPKSEQAYRDFYAGGEFDGLFTELIVNRLAIGQIMLLLQEKPLSTSEMAEILGLNPSEISRHINRSSRQGLVRYDESRNCYALA